MGWLAKNECACVRQRLQLGAILQDDRSREPRGPVYFRGHMETATEGGLFACPLFPRKMG
jgi:hypothetical protein